MLSQNAINFLRDKVNAQCESDGEEPEWPDCEEGNLNECLLPFMCSEREKFKSYLTKSFASFVEYNNDLSNSTDPIKIADNKKLEEFKVCFSVFTSFCMMFPTYCKSDLG
nr:uncharacterized protein LOC107441598 [Parasteatoda tepidariorum]